MSWFYWDREGKWTSYNGTERINGLYLGQEDCGLVENHNIVGAASPFHPIYLSDLPDIQAHQVPHWNVKQVLSMSHCVFVEEKREKACIKLMVASKAVNASAIRLSDLIS